MSSPAQPTARAQREAGAWFARLRTPSITAAELARFETWRADPANDAAFAALQGIWHAGEGLQGDPQIDAAIVDAMVTAPRRAAVHRRSWATAVVGLAVAFGITILVALSFPQDAQTFQSAIGKQRIVRLADGSIVRLDTDSQVVIRQNPRAREVELARGRAFFDVAHDTRRPFIVTASSTQVRAVGTRFIVDLLSQDVAVTLVQGVVTVRQRGFLAAPPRVLHPGETLTGTPQGVTRPQRSDAAAETAWMGGHIVFHDKPLAEAIAEANRYTTNKLRLADDAALGSVHVDGVFNAGDTPALLGALQTLYGLKAIRQSDGVILLQHDAAHRPAIPPQN